MDGVDAAALVAALNEQGIRTHVRKADHYSGNILTPLGLLSCVRVSLCHYNSEQEVSQFLASDAALRQIRVQLELAAGLPPAWSDSIEFQQVLLNLVRNGFDAMADTPSKDRRLTIQTKQLDLLACFDQSCGIDSRDQRTDQCEILAR